MQTHQLCIYSFFPWRNCFVQLRGVVQAAELRLLTLELSEDTYGIISQLYEVCVLMIPILMLIVCCVFIVGQMIYNDYLCYVVCFRWPSLTLRVRIGVFVLTDVTPCKKGVAVLSCRV